VPVSNRTYAVRVGCLALLLVICGIVYGSRSQTFPVAAPSSSINLTNASILRDWAPEDVYSAAVQHIEYYLAVNNVAGKSITITNTPRYGSDGSFSFEFNTDQTADINTVTIETTDYGGGLVSSAVSINGDPTTYTAAAKLYGAGFGDFDSLINNGLTGGQVYEIQKQLVSFAGDARFDIDTDSINQAGSPSNTKTTLTLTINDHKYKLVNNSTDIDNIHIVLIDGTKQVFDSKVVHVSN
jgi:hypothetical protein